MRGTRWATVLRESLGAIHRELRITLTPVPRPRVWAFIVGCYNSGTTLLARMLASHPEIAVLPTEGQFLTDQFARDYELGVPRMWVLREDYFRLTEADAGADPVRLKKEWGSRLDRRRPVLVEKSPPNAARVRWLQHHFENAHFIALVRNGYAVAEGIRRKAEPRHRPEGWPIALCARQWARSNEVLLEDAAHLDRVLWVRYEDLAERPDDELARMFEFLGLNPGNAAGVAGARFAVHERDDAVRDLNAESIGRLSAEDIAAINAAAAPMLARFGYPVLGTERARP